MAHESFEDPAVAAVMNQHFVNIKVDREERPDIDQIYMTALHALGQQGGWPLTMFLTPAGEPFWGGTYFPKEPRWGRPGFVDVLMAVHDIYRSDRDRVDVNRMALLQRLVRPAPLPCTLPPEIIAEAGRKLQTLIDPIDGGIGTAPKFPHATVTDLLWRSALRTGDDSIARSVLHGLRRMSLGGIYDHIGGGLSRYSVDRHWLVPHFEKMLYDNAMYIRDLSVAWCLTGQPLFRRRINETVSWLLREMRVNGAAFAASLDADSEGQEGKYYVWTPDEINAVLGAADGELYGAVYDITGSGNFEGRSIPNLLSRSNAPTDEEDHQLAPMRAALHTVRQQRVPPQRDDKVLADWNGLLIASLAHAARNAAPSAVSRESWRRAAIEAYRFVMDVIGDRSYQLAHAWRNGQTTRPAFASDYAAMMQAALALAETEFDPAAAAGYIADAAALAERLDTHYKAPSGGYYLVSDQAKDVLVRIRSALDEAVPNHNALAVEALVRLWHWTGDDRYRARADEILGAFAAEVPDNIFGHAAFLAAFDTRLDARFAVIVAPDGTDSAPISQALTQAGDPALIRYIAESTEEFPRGHPARGKVALDGKPTLYLCREGTCSIPITDPQEVNDLIRHVMPNRE